MSGASNPAGLTPLRPWTPLKDYARAPMGRRGDALSVNLQIPEGTYDPVLGMSYQQISR